jgi:hypothetical protein
MLEINEICILAIGIEPHNIKKKNAENLKKKKKRTCVDWWFSPIGGWGHGKVKKGKMRTFLEPGV